MSLPLVVITGASSGIGEAAARRFSEAGHPLLLIARRGDRLQALNLPSTVTAAVDVTDREAVRAAIAEAEQRFGPVDCMVNNAGLMLLGYVVEQDPEEWKRMLDVNILGVMNGIHAVLAGMLARRGGTIINVSSVSGHKSFPNHAVYCGAKSAVISLSETLREEVSGSDVRVIVITPGATETELLSHTTSDEIKESWKTWKASIGGWMHPDDVARAILFAYQQPQNVCIREIVLAPTREGP